MPGISISVLRDKIRKAFISDHYSNINNIEFDFTRAVINYNLSSLCVCRNVSFNIILMATPLIWFAFHLPEIEKKNRWYWKLCLCYNMLVELEKKNPYPVQQFSSYRLRFYENFIRVQSQPLGSLPCIMF